MRITACVTISLTLCCAHAQQMQQSEGTGPIKLCRVPDFIVISERYPEPWVEETIEAIEYWNQELGHEVLLYGGRVNFDDHSHHIGLTMIDVTDDPDITACAITDYHYKPGSCAISAKVLIKRDCVNSWTKLMLGSIIRHEIGHVLGLGHSDYQTDLMYPEIMRSWEHPKDCHPQDIEALKIIYSLE